jgi:hypothetical protein
MSLTSQIFRLGVTLNRAALVDVMKKGTITSIHLKCFAFFVDENRKRAQRTQSRRGAAAEPPRVRHPV